MKKTIQLGLAGLLITISLGVAPTARAQQACQAYTVDRSETPYGLEEINNWPLLVNGTFSNATWEVDIWVWEPAAYRYEGINLRNGCSISLFGLDVTGTIERPQYRFHNGDTTYVVSFRYTDPDTIRVEVFQGRRVLLNELLYR